MGVTSNQRPFACTHVLLHMYKLYFLPKKKNKGCERNTETSNPHGFEQ